MDKKEEGRYDPFSIIRVILSDVLPAAAFHPDLCDFHAMPVPDGGVREGEEPS